KTAKCSERGSGALLVRPLGAIKSHAHALDTRAQQPAELETNLEAVLRHRGRTRGAGLVEARIVAHSAEEGAVLLLERAIETLAEAFGACQAQSVPQAY